MWSVRSRVSEVSHALRMKDRCEELVEFLDAQELGDHPEHRDEDDAAHREHTKLHQPTKAQVVETPGGESGEHGGHR